MFLTICKKLQFPAEAAQVLTAAQNTLERETALAEASQLFLAGSDPTALLQSLSEKHNIPFATVTATCLVQAVPGLLAQYRARGVDERVCWDTLIDLTCKLKEHHDVEGIWGTEAIVWYQRLFTMKILKLGRLEYEPIGYRWDTAYGSVAKDCPVLNIHIPSCGSLPTEQVIDSLKQAYAFFGGQGKMPFVCASWMLYPPMCEAVFPKDSNLYAFYRCFDMAEQYADPSNKHFWRIFGVRYAPEVLATAPADTTLRRNLLAWMREGNHMGIGRGAFLFDGENILHVLS